MIGNFFRTALGAGMCLAVFAQGNTGGHSGDRTDVSVIRVDKLLMANEAVSGRLRASEPIPSLNASVTVDELGIRIPPAPSSPGHAFDHFQEIKTECPKSLAYLNKELEQLFKDQASDIARMRTQPELARIGQDSPHFQRLLILSKARQLNESETKFIARTQQLWDEYDNSSERSSAVTAVKWDLSMAGAPLWVGSRKDTHRYLKLVEAVQHSEQQVKVFDNQSFLDQYNPIFAIYQKAVDDYVRQLVTALETPESKLPLSALVLARLCKIRIMTTYQVMIRANFQIWASSAGAGAPAPRQDTAATDASFSGISWTH
jgi:hypothetical protein